MQGLYFFWRMHIRVRGKNLFGGAENAVSLTAAGPDHEMFLLCFNDRGAARLSKDVPTPVAIFTPTFTQGSHVRLNGSDTEVKTEYCYEGKFDLGRAMLLRLDVKEIIAPSYSNQAIPEMSPERFWLGSCALAFMASNRPDHIRGVAGRRSPVGDFPSSEYSFSRARVIRTEYETIISDGKTLFLANTKKTTGGTRSSSILSGSSPNSRTHGQRKGTPACLGGTFRFNEPVTAPGLTLWTILIACRCIPRPKRTFSSPAHCRKLLSSDPDLQIVATSHSPYLLDQMQPQEVRLTMNRDEGSVACARLDEHPEFEKWKDMMAPGEFWSFVGESWVAHASSRVE